MKLKWNDKHHLTGIAVIDAQHKEMFDHVDRLVQASQQEEQEAEFIDMLDFLGGYVVEHFRCEEDLMERQGCPNIEENKEDHRKLMAELEGVKTRFEQEGNSDPLRKHVISVAAHWLDVHVAGLDTRLREASSN